MDPRRAMVLAAGKGTRMRPLTDRIPKPLVSVNDCPLIDRILGKLHEANVNECVVNLHHLGDVLKGYLISYKRPNLFLSQEEAILETGGGVQSVLSRMNNEPFFVINGDVLWVDGSIPTLRYLAMNWDDSFMDCLLLLQPVISAYNYGGPGDFFLKANGRIERRGGRENAPFLFAGIQILHPRLFEQVPSGAFSLNVVYDRAIDENRCFGVIHHGHWCHVSTTNDISLAKCFLERVSRESSIQP